MTIPDSALREIAGLNTDGISGFRAQMALRRDTVEIDWPAHLAGPRIEAWRTGSDIARRYMLQRRIAGAVLRSTRARDFREDGITSNCVSVGVERREDELAALRQVVEILSKALSR